MALPVPRVRDDRPDTRERSWPSLFDGFGFAWPPLLDGLESAFTPLADVEETDDAYLVEIELAGVKRSDVDVTMSGRRLTVTGERKEKERTGILRRQTRTVGRFHYEVTLPGDVEADEVEAGMADGVLTVRLPKHAADRPRRVAIG